MCSGPAFCPEADCCSTVDPLNEEEERRRNAEEVLRSHCSNTPLLNLSASPKIEAVKAVKT